jgi:hypothetical protein
MMERGTGQTSSQMNECPKGAVYIWCNNHLEYPRALALHLGRIDLDIRGPASLAPAQRYFAGKRLSGVVLDHASRLTSRQIEGLVWVRALVDEG